MLRGVLIVSVIVVTVILTSVGASAKRGVLPYQGTLKQSGQPFTGTAELKFAIVDGDVVLWSNDTIDGRTGQPRRSVTSSVISGRFAVSLGAPPMIPLDIDEITAHPSASLRVWVSAGGPFEQLTDQAITSTQPQGTPATASGIPAAVWSLKGNRDSNPPQDFLGTTDQQPLVLKTNAQPVLTLQTDGTVDVTRDLHVHGNEAVDKNLGVTGNLAASGGFTLSGPLSVSGNATISGDLSVGGQGRFAHDVHMSGGLTADAASQIGGVGLSGGNVQAAGLAVSGDASCKTLTILGADLAEPFPMSTGLGREPEPGTVMSIDPKHPGNLVVAQSPYDRLVAGVLSGANGVHPGVVIRADADRALVGSFEMALSGRVYVRATSAGGPIEPGDLLTSSGVPGCAMRASDMKRAHGAVLGKAMSSLRSGTGYVLLLVQPQ